MLAVFRAGGDTDSVGAMVGACIGAQLGFEKLPQNWPLQHREALLWLSDRLANPRPKQTHCGTLLDVRGDIAIRDVDVVINAWNRNVLPRWLLVPQGVSRALTKAGAGCSLRELSKRGPLPLGASVETGAGGLLATWIVHADAIDLTWRATDRSGRSATRSALQLAHWLGAETVALPMLGAGSGGLSEEMVYEVVRGVSEEFLGRFARIELVRLHR